MDTWEYCIEHMEGSTGLPSVQRFAEFGENGWELAAAHSYMYHKPDVTAWPTSSMRTAWVFKRKIVKELDG